VLWTTMVTTEHLETLGIRLLTGRGFTVADRQGAQRVVLISQRTARRYWPDKNPIGRRLRPVSGSEWSTIVGVVEDVRNFSIAGPPGWVDGEIYLPLAQALYAPRTLSLVARLEGDTSSFEKRLPAMIRQVCANCAVGKVARMETVVADAVQAPRSMAWLMGGFAFIALGLAGAGIYGVVSHGVLRRTREVGVRLALGASRGSVAWLIMRSSLLHTMLGTAVGLFVALSLARLIETLLFGVTAHDTVSFTVAPVLLVAAAIFASLFPMYRAVRIDPAKSLREG